MKTSITKNNENSKFTSQKNELQGLINKIIILIFWFFVWQLVYFCVNEEILVPAPGDVFFRAYRFLFNQNFWYIVFLSMLRIFLGFLAATVLGTILAIVTERYKFIALFLNPILTVIKTTPVASFAVLALVFIKSIYVPFFISFLMVLPIIWINVSQGIHNTDVKLLEMAGVFKFSNRKKIIKIYLPSVIPYLMPAVTMGFGFAWKSGIAAEVIGNTGFSIGSQIYNSKIYLETVDLFAWTLIVIILSLILEKIIILLTKPVIRKFSLEG